MDQIKIVQTLAKHSGEFLWVRGVAIGLFATMGLIVTQLFFINDNIATVENRLTNVEGRLTNVEGRLTELETDFSDLKAGQQQIVATLVQMGQQLDSLSVSLTERNNQ